MNQQDGMTYLFALLMAGALQPQFQSWPEEGTKGTILIDSVGCTNLTTFDKGYKALGEGNRGAAQLVFARGIAEGECRMFEAGEEIFRGWKPLWSWTIVGPGAMKEAIGIHPASEVSREDAHPLDAYFMLVEFIHFPK